MKQIFSTLLLTFFFVPFCSFAHGSLTVARTDHNGYMVVIDAYVELYAGITNRLNFEIQKKSTTTGEMIDVPFTDAWVRIAGPNDEILFTGNIIHAPDGIITGFSYLYPTSGMYEITLRFMNGEHVITEVPLNVTITPNEKSANIFRDEWFLILTAFGLGILMGSMGVSLKIRQRSLSQKLTP